MYPAAVAIFIISSGLWVSCRIAMLRSNHSRAQKSLMCTMSSLPVFWRRSTEILLLLFKKSKIGDLMDLLTLLAGI
jgi:hypothetical protein